MPGQLEGGCGQTIASEPLAPPFKPAFSQYVSAEKSFLALILFHLPDYAPWYWI
jgi:hypothetical protein